MTSSISSKKRCLTGVRIMSALIHTTSGTPASRSSAAAVCAPCARQITASEDGYNPPFGHDGGTLVKSIQVDPAAAGLPFDTIEGDVVAMWYLGPWSTELEPGWGITATGIDGISEGDTIQVLSGDYFGMGWDIAGEVTAGADGAVTLTNDDCGGVHFLSTLVLVKK